MNIFTILPQYSGDSIIETSNQLRNSKKKLKRLEEKNGDSKEIKKLNILINEYVNKNKYNKKNTTVKMEKQFDEVYNDVNNW